METSLVNQIHEEAQDGILLHRADILREYYIYRERISLQEITVDRS